jgi:hypothetical protein
MPQPNSDSHITSPPSHQGQPYSAPDDSHSGTGIFKEVQAGPCDLNTGRCQGESAWDDGSVWKQT